MPEAVDVPTTSADLPIRRPGSPWRLLVHDYVGRQPDGTLYATSRNVSNDPGNFGSGPFREDVLLPAIAEFDELVVGRWLHVEQMDACLWWMDVGGLVVRIRVDREGRPLRVRYGIEDPVDGVAYEQDGR